MEWISVKDRLPEPFQEVLVYGSRGYYGLANTQTDEVWRAGQWLGEITHWIPLPEPPSKPLEETEEGKSTIYVTINVQSDTAELTLVEFEDRVYRIIKRAMRSGLKRGWGPHDD